MLAILALALAGIGQLQVSTAALVVQQDEDPGEAGEDQAAEGSEEAAEEGAEEDEPEPAHAPHDRYPSVEPYFERVGSELCILCHPEVVQESGAVRHLRIALHAEEEGEIGGCEICHGRGSGHLNSADPADIYGSDDEDIDWVAEGCLVCHTQVNQAEWLEAPHWAGGVTCNSCHNMHEPESGQRLLKYDREAGEEEWDLCFTCHQEMENEFNYYSHHPIYEGRMSCWDCHDVHRDSNVADNTQAVVDQCVTCHANYKPPFVFEHEPVTQGLSDGCLTCHQPHGAANDALLRLPGNAVCVQCHVEQSVGHFGGATCWQSGCHQQQHGSNISPLFLQ
jgi:DmsE family decaheme c-type cytochrome